MNIVDTTLLSSNNDGMSANFHLLAMSSRAACRILQTSFLFLNGIDSIFRRRRENSGPDEHGDCINWDIRQDQKIWSREPVDPQDLQQ